MPTSVLEAADLDRFVMAIFNRERREGDAQFWMLRGRKLVVALLQAIYNSRIAGDTHTDALSGKFLSDLLFSDDTRYRPEDLASVEEEARRIFHWIDEIHAGVIAPDHMEQCDFVLSLYRNELPRFAILRDLIDTSIIES